MLISITARCGGMYRDPKGQLHWQSITMLTDDTAHDHHAVNTFTRRAAMGSQWQHPVPRALRMETNFQTQIMDLSFGLAGCRRVGCFSIERYVDMPSRVLSGRLYV
ncbi:hypothetical protein PoB_001272700 [Plakobranchus ocellatus]|uniref:Uncharacterized protein n=1 Tax=Plakobranchus ocellatus TaxID=259542 RepID=A0AAV3YTG5_9GAST|nr:hypothetical protein PoB_001272700 [Plakobranchus ocellatus]